MEAQTSEKQYQAIAPVSRFDLRSSVGAQTKAVDPVSRFRWALSFPGIAPAAGKVLAALADHGVPTVTVQNRTLRAVLRTP